MRDPRDVVSDGSPRGVNVTVSPELVRKLGVVAGVGLFYLAAGLICAVILGSDPWLTAVLFSLAFAATASLWSRSLR